MVVWNKVMRHVKKALMHHTYRAKQMNFLYPFLRTKGANFTDKRAVRKAHRMDN